MSDANHDATDATHKYRVTYIDPRSAGQYASLCWEQVDLLSTETTPVGLYRRIQEHGGLRATGLSVDRFIAINAILCIDAVKDRT